MTYRNAIVHEKHDIVIVNEYHQNNNKMGSDYRVIGYEPADLTVHPPPKAVEGGFIFRCLVFPKNVLKGKPVPFGVIEIKRPKNVVFGHIHSNQIFKNLSLFDDNE